MSMCFPLGCQVQISSPTEMCFFFFFSNSRSSCDTATGVALYMTGKLAFVHKQDLQINKLCDCRCKVSGTVPQKSRTKRCEFIENSTELNRQKSCKNRIHSWSHAPLSLCTIYCSHQVRGWLVAVGGERSGEGGGAEHSRGLLVVIQRYILFPQTFLSSVVLDLRRDPEGASVSSSTATCSQGPSLQRVPPWNISCGARGAVSPPPRQVSRPQKKAQI